MDAKIEAGGPEIGLMTRRFYSFLGVQSFLIGLFPFYIPVYLYTAGFSLAQITRFIAATGLGFCISLYVWDRISKRVSLRSLIVFSFLSEIVLLTGFFFEKNMSFVLISGCFNGVFNCCFWIPQRLLFIDIITPQNSGQKFGNFQIFVLLVLKMGILTGGILLERSGYLPVYSLSAGIVILVSVLFFQPKIKMELDKEIESADPMNLKRVAGYKDRFHSKVVFAIDGVFLYLESYFWVISLFLIVRQSYWKLGALVIFLALVFGTIFVMIKNTIDRLPANIMYSAAVCLYGLSWALRSALSEKLNMVLLFCLLAIITFCTSIFRLAFNKRFFDIAKTTKAHEYIFVKSYFSQFFLVVFALAGFHLLKAGNPVEQLSFIYLAAALISFCYLFYTPGKKYDH